MFVVSLYGLDGPQWGIAFAIGLSSFVVNILMKILPDGCCPKIGKDSVDDRRIAAKTAAKEK